MADVNGDGIADIVGFASSGVYVSLSTGPGFTRPSLWLKGYAVNVGGWSSFNKYPRPVADVNGDGKADVVGFGYAGVYVSLSSGSGFSAPAMWFRNYAYGAGGWSSCCWTYY